MKTIKQAAEEYANQERITRSEFAAFIDGVEFAQHWISVDDKLPADRKRVLMRYDELNEKDNISTGFFSVEWAGYKNIFLFGRNDKECTNMPFRKVTHWRYIDLK